MAVRLGLNLSEIHKILGISKAMVYAYRGGKNRITQKVWLKLAEAENKAVSKFTSEDEKTESSAKVKDSDVGESACVMREDSPISGARHPQQLSLDERVERLEKVMAAIAEALKL